MDCTSFKFNFINAMPQNFIFFLISEIDVMHLIHWCYRYRLIKTKDTRTTTAWIIGSHYLKSVRIRVYGPEKTPYLDTFHAISKLVVGAEVFSRFSSILLKATHNKLSNYLTDVIWLNDQTSLSKHQL